MSEVLYRSHRPHSFKDVVGQDHVVLPLQKAIANKKIAHAYLFAGSRGIGKTSIARIVASEIGTHADDVYEIDAASNRGIDDVRALREAVYSLPFRSSFKVYIIDEVHMLTKEAFNALLKTLEEPPLHVIFMLATTELQKIPDTIVSRCEVYHLKRPSVQTLAEQVSLVAKKEGYSISKASAELIAKLGDGSFRDTLGVLQKVIAMSKDKKLDDEEVRTVLGVPGKELIHTAIEALHTKDCDKVLTALSYASSQGFSPVEWLAIVLENVRTILLIRYAKTLHQEIKEEYGDEEFEYLFSFAKDPKSGISSALVAELLVAEREMKISYDPRIPLELAFMRLFGHNG